MNISPRKNEWQAVVDLLESDEFDSAEKMAKAIVKTVAEQIALRDNYGVALRLKGESNSVLAVGPFYDKRDAEKFLDAGVESGLAGFVAPLTGVEAVKVNVAEAHGKMCVACGHRAEMHGQVKVQSCAVYKCECKGLTIK